MSLRTRSVIIAIISLLVFLACIPSTISSAKDVLANLGSPDTSQDFRVHLFTFGILITIELVALAALISTLLKANKG
jgi:hypothetical protein